ncbi:MAG: GNAT family N-acetyltransferase [Methylococcales bacterium]|nr:GNAT family N-acetyltransferase [Methylococcales bacterium]
MTELNIQFRVLDASDKRTSFCCGNIDLDRFFQRYAGQNQFRHHVGITYVMLVKNCIAGFVTVSAGEISVENLPGSLRRRLPEYPLPIMRIARLAIDEQFQRLGLGKKILRASFQLAFEMKARFGCIGIVVDAKQQSIDFYKKLGLVPLQTLAGELGDRPQPQPLFLSIRTIELAQQDKK